MNRRQFNLGLTTLGAAPLLPALPARAAAATGFSGPAAMYYPWAARYAQVNNACSPAKLAKALRMAPDVAEQVFARLQLNGVVTAPGLTGIARAVNPVNWDMQLSSGASTTARSAEMTRRFRLRAGDDTAPENAAREDALETAAEPQADPALVPDAETDTNPADTP